MRIKEVLEIIESKKREYGIEEFRRLLKHVGNPQHQLKCVHVAGTNGKGSTSNYIYHILKQKYKVGLFTSPYFICHNDRIRVNDQLIPDEKIIEYYDRYHTLWDQFHLSSFEIDMFMAIFYFIEEKVDVCVFEVGLGGELDATNVIHSLVSIITNISYDHQSYLGNTLEEIAQAKAGIIKENSIFITADEKHIEKYQTICHAKNTKCVLIHNDVEYKKNHNITFQYKGLMIQLNTIADYQVKNSILALEAVFLLTQFPVTKKMIVEGLKNATWRGRCEVIQNQPTVLIDGAHNIAGIEALLKVLKPYKDVKVIFSAVADKDYPQMLQLIKNQIPEVYVTHFDFYRAITPSQIQTLNTPVIEDVEAFIAQHQDDKGLIVICGSLYFISDIINKRRKK